MQTLLRCAVVGFLLMVASIVLAQPALKAITPRTIVPGAMTEVTITGTNLVDPLQVWTSFQATVEIVPVTGDATASASRTIKVTPAADSPLSLGAIFVGTPAGATDVQLLILDELPNERDSGENHSFESAQKIPDRCAVEGTTETAGQEHLYLETQAALALPEEGGRIKLWSSTQAPTAGSSASHSASW